jgi:hypothetical protein
MQLSSARRMALQSAIGAMRQHDLQKLKMLDVWVRNRAQITLMEPDDLAALAIAIACLEAGTPPSDSESKLDALQTGKLREPARAACAGPR